VAFQNTYKMPIIITHTMNVFGERQHPEKFIPKVIKKVLAGEEVIIHGSADRTKSGTRFWIHARNVAQAMHFLMENPKVEDGDKFNVVGEKEVSNLEIAQKIADILGEKLNYRIVDFHKQRPGHDFRYALDGEKMDQMGWQPPINFDASFKKTIEWMTEEKRKHWLYDQSCYRKEGDVEEEKGKETKKKPATKKK
jgi:dTDP-glucose 4,6-dehydratase